MALERIPPTVRVQPARSTVDPGRAMDPSRAAAEDRLRLLLSESPAGELLGRASDGRSFRIGNATLTGAPLTPGQVLLVRIVRTTPNLELMVLGEAPSGDGMGRTHGDGDGGDDAQARWRRASSEQEPAALQTDQAAMRRLTRSAISPPVLAAAWRALVLSQMQYVVTVPPTATPTATPPSAAAAGAHTALSLLVEEAGPLLTSIALSAGAAEKASQAGQARSHDDTVLVLRVQAWADWPVLLCLVQGGGPYTGANRRSARRNGVRLRLVLDLPAWGPIDIEVDVLDTAVALTLTATRAESLPALRSGVTTIVARLNAAGLRLVRCRIKQGEPYASVPEVSGRPSASLAAAQPPLVLFRAATEVLAALAAPGQH